MTRIVFSLRGRVLSEKSSLITYGDIDTTSRQGRYGHRSHEDDCWVCVCWRGRGLVPTARFKAVGQRKVGVTEPIAWSSLFLRLLAWPWQVLPHRLYGEQHPAWTRYGAAQLHPSPACLGARGPEELELSQLQRGPPGQE